MNKLVLLSEVRKGKTNNKNKILESNKIRSVQEDTNKSYITFKKKFDCFQNQEVFIDLNGGNNIKINRPKYEKRLNKIMKRIFLLDNKTLITQFISSIYNDDLSTSTRIQYINEIDNEVITSRNSNYSVRILAEDEYRRFQYEIQFQTRDNENIAILISKIDLTNHCDNIVNLSKKRREYEEENLNKSLKENYTRCLILLNSNIEVPDVYEIKSNLEGQNIDYKVNVIKGWKYDFKQLVEKNMYLLFPIKVLDLRKRLISISQEAKAKDLIKDEVFRFFKDMNKYLKNLKNDNLITEKDINEINLITVALLNNILREKNNIFVDIKRDIQTTLKGIVV